MCLYDPPCFSRRCDMCDAYWRNRFKPSFWSRLWADLKRALKALPGGQS